MFVFIDNAIWLIKWETIGLPATLINGFGVFKVNGLSLVPLPAIGIKTFI